MHTGEETGKYKPFMSSGDTMPVTKIDESALHAIGLGALTQATPVFSISFPGWMSWPGKAGPCKRAPCDGLQASDAAAPQFHDAPSYATAYMPLVYTSPEHPGSVVFASAGV